MNDVLTLTQNAARSLMLAAQGLDGGPVEAPTKAGLSQIIRQMGVLQIDTIHVVARSPYLVLWSRLGNYPNEWLEELHAGGDLFEYWAHAMCFLPIEDYPLFRRFMLDLPKGYGDARQWLENHRPVAERVLEHIRQNGPARSSDFVNENHQSGGWWDHKEEKIALDCLHWVGELMIARREKFQRIYDLRERVLPDWDDNRLPDIETVQNELALRSVRALGVTPARWAPDYYRLKKTGMAKRLESLVESGRLLRVKLEGWEEPAYVHPDHAGLLEKAAAGELRPTLTTLLSPFDPLIWDRERARSLFHFDYNIECYLPAPKRRYGYFTLPILHRGALVGRLDPKAHRKEGIFEVKALYLEPGVQPDDQLLQDLAGALQRLANWHNTPEVVIRRSDPPGLAESLSVNLKA